MISCKAISSSGGAAKYFYEQAGQQEARGEYYAKDEVRTEWGGRGAELASYQGRVTKDDLVKVLDGKVVDRAGARAGEERQLGKAVLDKETGNRVIEHRCGVDFTFSAPKSVSINSEAYGQADVRAAHEKGVAAAMEFLEKHAAQARVMNNGKPEVVKTGNLIYAKIEHSLARAAGRDATPDPQTHTHVVIANMTEYNGKWYSLSNEKLLDLRATADAIYKNEMAADLQRNGHVLEFDSKGNFERAGYSKEQLDAFSQRSTQIDAELVKRGIDPEKASSQAKQVATLATRQGKDAPESAKAMREAWQQRAAEVGIVEQKSQGVTANAIEQKGYAGEHALEKAINHLTEREAAFSEKDLYKETARFSEGRTDYRQIEKAVDKAMRKGDLIMREDGKYTTKDMVHAEKSMENRLEAGKGAHQAVMTSSEFKHDLAKWEAGKRAEFTVKAQAVLKAAIKSGDLAAIEKARANLDRAKNFQLSPEQRNAAGMILTGNDRFQGVQGLAGTGKTTMLEFVRTTAESKGWQVRGFSNGSNQAQKMQKESGIKSTTTAKHLSDHQKGVENADLARMATLGGKLENGRLNQSASNTITNEKFSRDQQMSDDKAKAGEGRQMKTLNIMDEASQSGQREFNAVIKATEQSGQRTVMLGDELQHQSVESGKAFEAAQKHMPTAVLGRESILRQQTDAAKGVVAKVLDGKHEEAAKAIPTVEIKSAQARVESKWAGKIEQGLKDNERQAFRAEMKEAAKADNKTVIGQLAKGYAGLSPKERQNTIVLTATNADRQGINNAIRSELKTRGEIGEGKTVDTLQKTDRTNVEMKNASSYQKGDVVQFTSALKSVGVEKGERGEVMKSDHRFGTVTVKMESGKEVTFSPERIGGKEVFERGQREFSKGDSVVFTKNDNSAGIRNGEKGVVEKMEGKTMTVKMESGERRDVDTSKYQHLDHGYVSTSHAAQGQTAKNAWEHHNTEGGRHGDREKYVNVTRAQEGHRVYTQDADKAAQQSGQKLDKETAQLQAEKSTGQERQPQAEKASEQERPTQAEKATGQERQPQAEKASEQERPAQAEKSTGQERQPQAEKASEQERQPQAEKSTGQERRPQAEKASEQERPAQAEKATGQERQPQAEKASEQERPAQTEKATGQDRQPQAEKATEQERQPQAEKSTSQERRPQAEKASEQGRPAQAEKATGQERQPQAEKATGQERRSEKDTQRNQVSERAFGKRDSAGAKSGRNGGSKERERSKGSDKSNTGNTKDSGRSRDSGRGR